MDKIQKTILDKFFDPVINAENIDELRSWLKRQDTNEIEIFHRFFNFEHFSDREIILEQELDRRRTQEDAVEEYEVELSSEASRRIFVVHGHDGEAKQTVARFLEQIDLEAVILHEQPDQGRTIIEKFERHANVSFAIVILTPDDVGGNDNNNLRPRARQNVVLELGYFIGKLGRNRIFTLKRGNPEIPTDYLGVLYTTMDDSGAWKSRLAREIGAAGIELNSEKVVAACAK